MPEESPDSEFGLENFSGRLADGIVRIRGKEPLHTAATADLCGDMRNVYKLQLVYSQLWQIEMTFMDKCALLRVLS